MTGDYSYEYEHDSFYCYSNSNVLKNKLNITNEDELWNAEREISGLRIIEASKNRVRGKFDYNHLKRIHKFLFGDIYSWAGKVRTVDISKGSQFCRVEFIDDQMQEIFDKLKVENYLKNLQTKEEIANRLAFYLGEINAIHPFREGNGRCQRMFIENLAYSIGYNLDFMEISNDEMLEASVRAFELDYTMLSKLLYRALNQKMYATCMQN